MSSADHIDEVKKRLLANPAVRDDVSFLIKRIEELEKTNKALSQHAMELSQEIENVRSDFGGDPR